MTSSSCDRPPGSHGRTALAQKGQLFKIVHLRYGGEGFSQGFHEHCSSGDNDPCARD